MSDRTKKPRKLPRLGTPRRMIYAAASGEYSDFRVHVLFETRADAEQHVLDRSREENDGFVMELSLYPHNGPMPKRRHGAIATGSPAADSPEQVFLQNFLQWEYDLDDDVVITPSYGRSTPSRRRAFAGSVKRARRIWEDAAARDHAEREGIG